MSTFKVEIVKVDDVMVHPNAEKLELAVIKGWNVVVRKGEFTKGSLGIYFPIDSVLPIEVETKIFGIDSKIKLSKSRIRTIKLRGAISQGLLVPRELFDFQHLGEGENLTYTLGVQKYEPPASSVPSQMGGQSTAKQTNPHFHKYGGIDNFKNYPNIFEDGEEISISEKIHGTHFRCGYVPYYANTFFKKLLRFVGLAPKYEFVFGSNNVQLQNKLLYKGYYDTNVYAKIVNKYDLKNTLRLGEVIHGEIYGDGIQKNYTYGCTAGEHKLVVFDVKIEGKYLNVDECQKFCEERQLKMPPELYRGPFNKELAQNLTLGDSVMVPSQKIREGVVIKPLEESICYIGRKMLKFISDEYLMKDQTDFH